MCSVMPNKINFLTKAFITLLIFKLLLHNVCFLMRCKFTIKNKRFITIVTFKWLPPTVHSLMRRKFTSNNKSFITKITLEWQLQIVNLTFILRVLPYVHTRSRSRNIIINHGYIS